MSNELLTEQCLLPTSEKFQPRAKNTEHYVAYNALCVSSTISCMYQHIQAKMHQIICVFSEQTAIIRPQKKRYFDLYWLTLGRPDRVKSSMFAFFVSVNAAKLFLSCSHC